MKLTHVYAVVAVTLFCVMAMVVMLQRNMRDSASSGPSTKYYEKQISELKDAKARLQKELTTTKSSLNSKQEQIISEISTWMEARGLQDSLSELKSSLGVTSSPRSLPPQVPDMKNAPVTDECECPAQECPSSTSSSSSTDPVVASSSPSSVGLSNPTEFWKSVGMSDHERECDSIFGMTLLESWRAREEEYCSPSAQQEASGAGSSLTCYRYHQARHSGPDIMCDGRNIAFDFSKPYAGNKQSIYGEDGHLIFPEGTQKAACVKQGVFSMDHFPMSQKDIMSSLSTVTTMPTCDLTVKHTVIPVIRYEYKNLFHQMTDFLNAYMIAVMTSADLNDIQIILLDNHVDGPFMDMWQSIAPGHPVMRPKDYNGQNVCFERVLYPVLGYGAPIAKDIARNNECPDQTLVRAFVNHFLKGMNLLETPVPSEPVITLISRKDYDGRSVSRKINNEGEVIDAIKRKISNARFQVYDFASITFREQVEIIRGTNILIGMHGAGLSHLLWLPKEAIVIELFQGDQQKHYRNFAKWADKQYMAYNAGSSVNVQDFLNVLDGATRLARSFNEGHGTCGLTC